MVEKVGAVFRRGLRAERQRRGWSQSDLTELLKARGIHLAATGITKIETGHRPVRIDEAAAIADVFGVSVDALLGRRKRPKADLDLAVRSVIDTTRQASWSVESFARTLRDQTDELAAADTSGEWSRLGSQCAAACDALEAAMAALGEVGQLSPAAGRAMRAVIRGVEEKLDREEAEE